MVWQRGHMNNNDILKEIKDFLMYYTGVNAYWYPLCKLEKDIPVVAYDLDKLYRDNCIGQLEETLKSYGLSKVKAIQMQNDNTESEIADILDLIYEKDTDGYTFPWYVETYYFDDSKEWMIYVSHEGTITFTGSRFVRIAKENIQNKYLY